MSLLSELFSDLFASRDNVMTRMDPRVKVVAALALQAGVVFASSPILPLLVFLGCVGAAGGGGIPARFIGMRLIGPLVIAGILLVLQGLLTGVTPLWSIAPFGMRLTITAEGWRTGVLTASRVLGGTSVMLLLSAVTPAHRIFLALRAMGISKAWVEIAMLTYRYIFVLLDQAVRTNEAMRVRGYRGEIPLGVMPPLAWRERWIIAGAALVTGAAFALTEIWHL
jgi:cobalt/nickel transport system permease protein